MCDTSARAFVKNIKSHNGYFGCDKCTQRGVYLTDYWRMTFPEVDAPLCTDASFAAMDNEEHYNGP